MLISATQKFKLNAFFCLKNLAFLFSTLITSCLLWINPAFSQQQVKSFDIFKIDIPDEFQTEDNKAAIVFLRHKSKQFPTFNIIKYSQPWPHERLNLEDKMARLELEYKQVGYKSAKAVEGRITNISGAASTYVEIEFISANKTYKSKVWVISLKYSHYIITSVFDISLSEPEFALVDKLISSIRLSINSEVKINNAGSSADKVYDSRSYPKKYSLLLVALIFVGYFYFKRPRKRPKD